MNQITNTNHLILLAAAQKLNINAKILSLNPLKVRYSHKDNTHLITHKSFNLNTSKKALSIARNKALTTDILTKADLPAPRNQTISNPSVYSKVNLPFPQVIKPLCGEKGKHVYLNINDKLQGQTAVNQLFQKYPQAIIETYHPGKDYRFLVLNFKVIGLAQRLPPTITGNGRFTIRRLIKKENLHRFKSNQKHGRRLLNRMRNWPRLQWNLSQQNLSLETILPDQKTIKLYPIPNFSTGGSVKTINHQTIHPSLINLVQTAAKTINLQICGIDILIKNLKKPPQNNATIIEINSDPGLRLHDWPNQGQSQHTAETILKSIFNL